VSSIHGSTDIKVFGLYFIYSVQVVNRLLDTNTAKTVFVVQISLTLFSVATNSTITT